MHPPRTLVLVTLSALLVAGCSAAPGAEPAASQAPITAPGVPTAAKPAGPLCTPLPTGAPSASAAPTPCSQAEFEAQGKLRARYAAAEEVYRKYVYLTTQEVVARKPKLSEELAGLATEPYRPVLDRLRADVLDRATFTGEIAVVWMRPA